MRITSLLALPLLAGVTGLVASPSTAPAQQISISFGTRLGPEIRVYSYSQERLGEWRSNYRHWTPVTLYDVNGRYFPKNGPGARQVTMYRYRNEYFLPPQDRAWDGSDRRFDYNHKPTQEDYRRARGHP